MKKRVNCKFVAMLLALVPLWSWSASPSQPIPDGLYPKIKSLFELHLDSTASWYSGYLHVRTVELVSNQAIVLVVSTVEGQGGSLGHVVYLAAFHRTAAESGVEHYRYLDSIPLGGKGWRRADALADATITHESNGEKLVIRFPAKECYGHDGPNFPTRPTTIHMVLEREQWVELPQQDSIVPLYGKGNYPHDMFWRSWPQSFRAKSKAQPEQSPDSPGNTY